LANHPTAEIWPPKNGLAADRQWNLAEGFADAEIRTEYRFLIKYHGLAIKVSPVARGSRLSRFLPPRASTRPPDMAPPRGGPRPGINVERLGKVALSHFVDDILLKFLFDGRKTCCTGLRLPISTPFAIRS
jgi:hypothetical protein